MFNSNMPTLLFFDLDGTLRTLPRNDGIPEENVEALLTLQKHGHKLVLNSGRSLGNYPKEALEMIPWDGIMAGCSFAMVEGKILMEAVLPIEALLHAIHIWNKYHITCLLEGRNTTYVIGHSDKWINITDTAENFIKKHYDEMNVTNICIEDDTLGFSDDQFPGGYNTYHGSYTEVNVNGYYKNTGMPLLSDYFHIPMSQTIAFGDSVNDIEMLKASAYSVLMPTAPEEMHSMATYLAKDRICGVAEGIVHYYPNIPFSEHLQSLTR